MLRSLFIIALTTLFSLQAWAEEKITDYNVEIEVLQNADFIVKETISVISEGRQIRRGIFRDLPRYKLADDVKIPYQYKILSVTRNGAREPFAQESEGNAEQVRIGDANVFLKRGEHVYEITYSVKNEVRYFDDFDEVYWNAIGTYWAFPIDRAKASVTFPQSFRSLELNCFTGRYRSTASDCQMSRSGNTFLIQSTRAFDRREGMAVSIKFPKGIIDPPSAADKRSFWWFKNGAVALLAGLFILLFGYYYSMWNKVGRDPAKDPVFARYGPPDGYSPAAVHHIYNRGFKGQNAIISTLVDMAVKGRIKLDTDDKLTTLSRIGPLQNYTKKASIEDSLENGLFQRGDHLTIGKKYNSAFYSSYKSFQRQVSKAYGVPYFRWNAKYTIIGFILSAFAIVAALSQFYGNQTHYFWAVIAALIVMNLAFLYFMPAPTRKGQKIRQEIAGFKLYLETAEKQKLNAVEVGSDQPLPMSKDQYEAFLPYAIALDVEKPWTKYFEKTLPQEAENYNPSWTNMRAGGFRSIGGMNDAITSNPVSYTHLTLPTTPYV